MLKAALNSVSIKHADLSNTIHWTHKTEPEIKSNFAEHIFNTNHTYTNIETNSEILNTLWKGPKLNTTEQYEIYKHYKNNQPI